jgi:ABC-type polysaccharide/polyol phosphate export permease
MSASKYSWLRENLSEMLHEQFVFRELLMQFTYRDLILRYKQSVMGFGWAICAPLLNMLIFSVIFMRVAPLHTSVPYPIYAYAGLLPWTMFANSIRFSAISLTLNVDLVSKVYFPREILPFSAILVSLVDFAVASSILVALMFYYGIRVTPAIVFLPVILLVQLAFTAGLSLLVAMGNLFYRDFKYITELGLTVWMLATSVVYPVELIHGRLGIILRLNPMTPIIDAYRAILLRGELPAAGPFTGAALFSVALFVFGWLVFHVEEFQFAENI